MRRIFQLRGTLVLMILLVFGTARKAEAIPVFARKYKTSCATCHTAFPKLNAFGQAFRRLGYHFPGGQDAEMVKEKPVSMGAEAYKKLWPNAIWPGDIPATAPIALLLESEVTANSAADQTNVDFSGMMGEMEVLAGGTLGKNINFLSSVEIGRDGVDIEMGYLGFFNLLRDASLNLKVGQFPPEVMFITTHRRFGPDYWITTRTVGDNEWSLEDSQKGFEASGILGKGRLVYDVGLVEGSGNIQNPFKEPYLHLAYKFGGLPYNGITEKAGISGQQGWGNNSLQIGGFTYLGKSELRQDFQDRFYILGTDAAFIWRSLKVNAAFSFRKDNQPFLYQSGAEAHINNLFVEGDYLIYPWLIPTLRYENFLITRNSTQLVNY
ncbi:MAG: hypothetical protein P8Y60_19865, partial [Calditrichota bacterium]